jgi:hypothetical protein
MAAFCGCCGAEIIDAVEACPVCGMPRHGMIPAGLPISLAEDSGAACCLESQPQGATHQGENSPPD